MLKSRDLVIGTAVGAALLSLAISQSRADLFDFLRPKRAAETTARGQSPGWQPAGSYAESSSTYSDSGLPTGWGYDSSPCFNCGDCDHYIRCTQLHRRRCGQTWYPRMAPYCEAGWGWTQPCWRRMADNYNCPRPHGPASTPRPPAPPPAPAAQPPAIPEPPPATSSRAFPPRAGYANRTVSYTHSGPPPAPKSAPATSPEAKRYARLADILEPEPEADDATSIDDETAESQMEAADGEVAEGDPADEESDAAEDLDAPPDIPE